MFFWESQNTQTYENLEVTTWSKKEVKQQKYLDLFQYFNFSMGM